jgi:hypothetical protein
MAQTRVIVLYLQIWFYPLAPLRAFTVFFGIRLFCRCCMELTGNLATVCSLTIRD